MKRAKTKEWIQIYLGEHYLKCSKCQHTRLHEPYAIFYHRNSVGVTISKPVCWRCCRDAESTLLIKQRWPIAFERLQSGPFCRLEWAPGVKELVGEHGKA